MRAFLKIRPISLLNAPMKIYEQVIKARLVDILEKTNFFSNVQAAYRKSRNSCDHILVLQKIFLHYRFKEIDPRGGIGKQILYLCFMDLKKAFDTVPRHLLFAKLKALGVEGKILNVIKDLYTSNSACIRIGDHMTESFNIESGVMQGSKLGPILFIYINDLLGHLEDSKLGIHIWNIVISAIGFTDDIIMLVDEDKNLQRLFDICAAWSKINGMDFNTDKCKVMILNGKRKNNHFTLHPKRLEKCQ